MAAFTMLHCCHYFHTYVSIDSIDGFAFVVLKFIAVLCVKEQALEAEQQQAMALRNENLKTAEEKSQLCDEVMLCSLRISS